MSNSKKSVHQATLFEDNAPALALYNKLGFERAVLPEFEDELAGDVDKFGRQRVLLRKLL